MPLYTAKVTHLHMGMGNDFYTMGLGDNLDDGLSFGSHGMVAFQDRIFLKTDALGFTDKLSSGSRYDQININLFAPFSFALGPFISTFTPLVGISLEGNFSFELMQNTIHNNINILPVNLSYDREQAKAHLNLGTTIQAMVPLSWTQVGLETSYLHTFGWENSTQILALFKLGSALTLKGGYSFMHSFGGGQAHETMMNRMSGPTFSYYFDGGLLTNSWIYHANSRSSYGVVGIDIMQLFQPVTYDHTDFTYSLGSFFDTLGNHNTTFSLAFGPIIWQMRQKNGPMKNDTTRPRRRIAIASWMIGYQMEWEATNLLYPYLKVLGGFQRFHMEAAGIETIKAAVAMETGLKFGSDGLWVAKNNSYRPRLSASIQYIFDAKDITTDAAFNKHVGPWLFFIGVAIDIGHDPH